jgi:4-amino-4-deoxy-L-arabinose transferase-like glycosyltransferase
MSVDDARQSGRGYRGADTLLCWVNSFDQIVQTRVLELSTRSLLIALFVTALALRALYAAVAVAIDPMLNGDPLMGDAASYDRIARSIAAGTGFSEAPPEPTAFWPPLYPAFLGAIYWVFGHQLMIARLINAALGALVPVVVFLLCTRLFDRRIALIAALGAVFYPLLIVLGAWVIPDGPYVLAVCLIMLLMVDIQSKPHATRYAALGALLGFAFLLKPVTAFFFPFLAGWFLLALPQSKLRQRFVAGVITALVLAAVLTPWTARNYVVLGSPIVGSANGGYTFYGANNPDAWGGHYEHFPARMFELSEGEEQLEFYRMGIEWIRSDPVGFLKLEVNKFQRLASPLSISSSRDDLSLPGDWAVRVAYSAFLVTALAGFVALRRSWRVTGLLAVPVLAVLLSTAVFYGDARYTMPMVPSLIIWSSVAIVAGWNALISESSKDS